MLTSFNQCFPDPLSGQWPATHHPILCECRQLYALVSVCCCVPSTHLLVLHDGVDSTVITSMPKGPMYLEMQITERTTGEAFCSFLVRAASSSVANKTYTESTHSRQVIILCLSGIASAVPAVLSALIDVLQFGLVRVGEVVRPVPSLRIVAYCNSRLYSTVLPEWLREGFTLSTYMSALSMESPAVIQSADPQRSNVVNRRHMLEVMLSDDGDALADTVTLSCDVVRYLRHLLVVVRSTICPIGAPGACIPSRVPVFLRLLKVIALLFAWPHERKPKIPTRKMASGSGERKLQEEHRQNQEPSEYEAMHITTFSRIVVSPAHVISLLCPMIAHLLAPHRNISHIHNAISMAPWARGTAGDNRAGCMDINPHGGEGSGEGIEVEPKCTLLELCDDKLMRWMLHGGEGANRERGDALGTLEFENRASTGVLDAGQEPLSYVECRELIRALIIQHSAPPKG
ncbi:hypothetical protein TRVL_01112 [Trypanosoma vivax]|uniref:Uncharacterized protein n=1 Tax=Trypanosoma vivax (strain Y486) TaxID=1055687 RepID=G0U706_TRYVY|nr:hypothetical protein TRVL_01112 [Trypanosoma vivax]CCC51663.1 conserved hypothetical protein [Trypanosoma vivax Y486]